MHKLTPAASAVAVILSAAAVAFACRIVPNPDKVPAEWRHRASLVHKEFKVDVKIDNQVAQVVVKPTFHNPHDFPIEGTYFLSLPAGAQVRDFALIAGGKRLSAELLDAGKARAQYQEMVRKTRDPALLELVGTQMLQASVGIVGPKADLAVEVSYTALLENQSGLVSLDVPFTNQFGGEHPVPLVSVSIDIASKTALKGVYSPTHSVDVLKKTDHSAKVAYEATNYNARKPFKLFYALSDDDIGLTLLTFREKGQDGFFLLMASPKVKLEEGEVVPKDVVFVMDRSGSMAGPKIQQARQALSQALNMLHPRDRFNVVDFSSEANGFESGLVEASRENLARATRYVENLKAAGSTNISEALKKSLGMLERSPLRLSIVLFATDGLPTVGEQNMDKILGLVQEDNGGANPARVFAFGVGEDVNTQFLDKLAEANRGARDYVATTENIEAKLSGLMEKISNPMLSNVSLDLGADIKIKDMYPRVLPDLFKGSQLVIFGRYEGHGTAKLTLKGAAGGKERVFGYDVHLPEADPRGEFIPRLWAARKVAFLVDSIRMGGGDKKEIIDEIVALGKRYGIVTPYTSFLITEENAAAMNRGGGERFRALADEAARSGKGDPKAPAAKAQGASRALAEDRDAADAEKLDKRLEEAKKEAGGYGGAAGRRAQKTGLRTVGTRTFFGRDGAWVDSEYDPEKMKDVVKVEFMSDAYFKLLEEKPALGKFFAVGDAVIVVLDGKAYQVCPPAEEKK